MAKLDVYDINGQNIGQEEVSPYLFESQIKEYLLHDIVRASLASRRAGTASTKGRSEVSGSGAKPWRQKGTGRARAGHRRSPIWRGGGVVFAPKMRNYTIKLNRTVKRQAFVSALSLKYRDSQIVLLENFALPSCKTKEFLALLRLLHINGNKLLVVAKKSNENVYLAGRNISCVNFNTPEHIVCYDVLNCETLLLDVETCKKLESIFG